MLSLFKLKEYINKKWNLDVEITFTTNIDSGMYGFVGSENTIFVNANKFFTEESILGVISHELAHILSNKPEHNEAYMEKLKEVVSSFNEIYGVDLSNVMDKIEIK